MQMTATRFALPLLMLSLPTLAAPAPTPKIDNERVTVWDVTLADGASGPTTPRDLDTVIMFVEGGTVRTTSKDGTSRLADHEFGDAVFVPKGTEATDTAVSGGPVHEIVVALKDHPVPPTPNTSGLPAAFPRPGSVSVLNNARVSVWNYSWTPGQPTPMHFHDKDVVVAYRYDGTLKSVTPDGTTKVNPYKSGEIYFNRANRAHYEELTTDRQSAVMMELK
jgi:quercetin dioxygenase-like cupin family protein